MSKLVLLTLPIGNYLDITLRALEELRKGGSYLCEDTREFKKILKLLKIDSGNFKLMPFHDHTQDQVEKWVDNMLKGEVLHIVSDAGSPLISDPAYPLVLAAIEKGISIETFPGVTAVITALELSGLPPHPFHFFGFLPRERGKKDKLFLELSRLGETQVFFEGTSRILETCEILRDHFPHAKVAIMRELTKKFESVYRFVAVDFKKENLTVKGEFVLIIYFGQKSYMDQSSLDILAKDCLKKASTKNIAKLLAYILDEGPKEIYQKLLLK